MTNAKIKISTLRFELVNVGTNDKPQNINIGLGPSSDERSSFIRLLKKVIQQTNNTSVIQQTIPMISNVKPMQQKLWNIHLNLESQIKSELNKILEARIIFTVRHSKWVSNLVPVRKKNGDIHICIDFINFNKACQKDNFPLPTMEQVLQSVAGFELMPFLDGFSGYNQILVHPDDRLQTTFQTKWGTYAYQKMTFGFINGGATFQRDVDIAFKGLVNNLDVIFLDDITVYSRKKTIHLNNVKQIFE